VCGGGGEVVPFWTKAATAVITAKTAHNNPFFIAFSIFFLSTMNKYSFLTVYF
jgi:hypothetical protein